MTELEPRRDEFPAEPRWPVPVLPTIRETVEAARANGYARPAPCHHCGQPATAQWQRHASDAQRESYWATVEANIRAQPNLIDDQNASYTADRSQPVLRAVFGCEQHQVPDMTMVHTAECGGHGSCQCRPTP